MSQPIRCFYEFEPFLPDPAEHLLFRDGQPVPLPPRAFEALLVLVENGGRVIDKDELFICPECERSQRTSPRIIPGGAPGQPGDRP